MDSSDISGLYGVAAWTGLSALDRDYFQSLPQEVQAGINQRANEIHSEDDLHRIAEKLMLKS